MTAGHTRRTLRPCRSCGAGIVFVATADGRQIPLDVEPRADGNLRLDATGIVRTARGEVPGGRYVSHVATCPALEGRRVEYAARLSGAVSGR